MFEITLVLAETPPPSVKTLDLVFQMLIFQLSGLSKEIGLAQYFWYVFGPVLTGFAGSLDTITPGLGEALGDLADQIRRALSTNLGQALLACISLVLTLTCTFILVSIMVRWALCARRRYRESKIILGPTSKPQEIASNSFGLNFKTAALPPFDEVSKEQEPVHADSNSGQGLVSDVHDVPVASEHRSLLHRDVWHNKSRVSPGGWVQHLLHLQFQQRIGKLIGRGGNAEVWEYLVPRHHKPLVVKTTPMGLPESDLHDMEKYASEMQSSVDGIRNEFNVLRQLSHPNVVKGFDFHQHSDFLGCSFTMERCDGDVESLFLKGLLEGDDKEILRFLVDVLKGLCHLHSHGLVHRDLKLANVLYNKADSVHAAEGQTMTVYKVTDFGWAMRSNVRDRATSTPGICPGEVKREGLITPQWDIYSLFVMLGRLLDMREVNLYRGETNDDVVKRLCNLTDRRARDFSDWFLGPPEQRVDAKTALERVEFIQSMPGDKKFPRGSDERRKRNESWHVHHLALLAEMSPRERIVAIRNFRENHRPLLHQIHPRGPEFNELCELLYDAKRELRKNGVEEKRKLATVFEARKPAPSALADLLEGSVPDF